METKRLSRFGIGPKIAAPSLLWTIAALAAGSKWPGVFILDSLPQYVRAAGGILTVMGILLWLTGAVTAMRAYNRDELRTTGPFALVRHPMYAGWISLAMPGFALVMRNWAMMLTPLLAYTIFRSLIHVEDEYLKQRFGEAYLEYRGRVNEVMPIPRALDQRAWRATGTGRRRDGGR
jgi:protein-S-isoprenylcysteine O-methyltransferase Ste14